MDFLVQSSSHLSDGSLSVINSATNISRMSTFKQIRKKGFASYVVPVLLLFLQNIPYSLKNLTFTLYCKPKHKSEKLKKGCSLNLRLSEDISKRNTERSKLVKQKTDCLMSQ